MSGFKVVRVRSEEQLNEILEGRSGDFWISAVDKRFNACKGGLASAPAASGRADQVFSHAFVLDVKHPRALANSLLESFGMGLRSKRIPTSSKKSSGCVVVYVKLAAGSPGQSGKRGGTSALRGGTSALCDGTSALRTERGDDRRPAEEDGARQGLVPRPSGEDGARQSSTTSFEVMSAEGLGAAATASPGKFVLTCCASKGSTSECLDQLKTDSCSGVYGCTFGRCLLAAVPDCRAAVNAFEAKHGRGLRFNPVKSSRGRPGALALLLQPRKDAKAGQARAAAAPAAPHNALVPAAQAGGGASSSAGPRACRPAAGAAGPTPCRPAVAAAPATEGRAALGTSVSQAGGSYTAPVLHRLVRGSMQSVQAQRMALVERHMEDLHRYGDAYRSLPLEARLQRAAQLACDMASAVVEDRPGKVCRLLRRCAGALEGPCSARPAVKREQPDEGSGCDVQVTLRTALCTGLRHLDLEDSSTRLCVADIVTHLGSMMATFIEENASLAAATHFGEWRELRVRIQSAFQPKAAASGANADARVAAAAVPPTATATADAVPSAGADAAPPQLRGVKREMEDDAMGPARSAKRRFDAGRLRAGHGGTHDLAP